jgi:hypothetical protein
MRPLSLLHIMQVCHSGRVNVFNTRAGALRSPHVLHESRHTSVVIVAIGNVCTLLLGQAIAHRTALALGDNQACSQQMLQIALQRALGCPIRKEQQHLTR